jgi:NADPH-dependent 2,4-dienoyl-CoA reductase/sulfur reductase-like enzyme/nitrite reductase/ring-hydroxylating ferredoxin subunit
MNQPRGADLEAGIDLAKIPEGGMETACWRGEPVLLTTLQGQVCALSATCTHMGAPLNEGIVMGGEVHCPWHHARFSLATGEAVGAPAFSPLKRFDTTIRDGRLFVTRPEPTQPKTPSALAAPVAGGDAHGTADRGQVPASRVVILGGGAGGHACAQWLIRSDFNGTVTVVSDDTDPPYDRTVCSKQYLIGMQSREDSLLPDSRLEGRGGDTVLRLGQKAGSIDIEGRSLLLDGGAQIGFDVLVLATGAEPKRPRWPGVELPNVHVLRTLKDADALIQACQGAKRVAIVGASFIGLEAAASLKQRKLDVHVVTRERVPLEKLLGTDIGKMIQAVHEEKGVLFHFGREVRGFDGERLTLDDGSSIEADFVVLGVGVTPRTEIAESAGIACAPAEDGGGVIVNERLETSHRGIFAIGDIARYPDLHMGKNIRVEHWVHAQRQGQHVARVIMGEADRYTDVPFFWSAHFDTGLQYLGQVTSILDTRTEGSVDGRDFSRYYRGPDEEKAFVTCNRDQASLLEESAWDGAAGTDSG